MNLFPQAQPQQQQGFYQPAQQPQPQPQTQGLFPNQNPNPMQNPGQIPLNMGNLRTFTATQNQENELQMVFNNFLNAMNLSNKDCLFKSPVYNEIPSNIHPNCYTTHTYVPDMDVATWEQFFRTNPNPNRFYVDQVRSTEDLMKRFSYRIEGFQNLNQQLAIQLKKSEDLKSQGCAQIKEKIKEIKAKNGILLDKILNVHNLIEKVAMKYSQFERATADEASVIKRISELENITSESSIKINDIRMNLIENPITFEKPQETVSNKGVSLLEQEEQKRKTLNLLEQMKQGIEILQTLSQRDMKEFKIFQDFIENTKY